MITEDELDNILKYQLKKYLQFELNGKIYKRGLLSLYKLETYHNNFEITFTFEKPEVDKVEKFKLPYPFNFETYGDVYGPEESILFFDYRIYTLTDNNKNLENYLKLLSEKEIYPKSKYFDKILKITCNLPA